MQMGFSTMTDEQLCLDCNRSSFAMEELVARYSKLVRVCARPYFLVGGEQDDLLQEGMLGLLHAVSSFDSNRGTTFKTFAVACIRNRLISAVRAADSAKHRLLNDSIPLCTFSLDSLSDEMNLPPTEQDPEELLIGREEFAELQIRLFAVLSPLERKTLELYLKGLAYCEIADLLHKSTKSVDNAVQRIRKKIAQQTNQASTAKRPFAI